MARKNLAKMCEDLYWLEKQARDLYDGFLRDLPEESVRAVVTKIRDDEERHMRLAQQLIDLVTE